MTDDLMVTMAGALYPRLYADEINWHNRHTSKVDTMTWREAYNLGYRQPNYQVPAIPIKVEYIFQGWKIDGIFVRVDDYAVCGAYRDGMEFDGPMCIPYEFDYPDQD